MIHQIGGLILLAIAVIVFGRLLGGEAARTWDARWPQTRPSRRQAVNWARDAGTVARQRAHARLVRSRAAGWMPARIRGIVLRPPAAAAAPGDGGGPGDAPHGSPAGQPPAGPSPQQEPPRPGPAPRSAASGTSPAPPAGKVVQGTVITGDDSPDAAPATPDAPQYPTGRTPGMSTAAVPGAEEMAAGMTRLRAYAVSGNINNKRRALAALAEVFAQDAATVAALARSMQEESMYGPEITEPVAQMAPALSALSTRAAEAESQVASLAATPVGEVPGSRHQAPARAEMAEAGGR